MSDEDDILAIVAAIELLQSRDETPPDRSKWKQAARDLERGDERERTWKNS
jgi:hypothetical protein